MLHKALSLIRSHRCLAPEKIVPVKHMGEGDSASFITRLNGTQEKINSAVRQLNFILVRDQNISDCYFYHRAQIWIIFSGLGLTKCLINNTLTYFNLLELCIILQVLHLMYFSKRQQIKRWEMHAINCVDLIYTYSKFFLIENAQQTIHLHEHKAARLQKCICHSRQMRFQNKLLFLAITTEIYPNANTTISSYSDRLFFYRQLYSARTFQRGETDEALTSSFQ